MTRAVPTGWISTSLDALGGMVGGKTPSKANAAFWEHGTIPWVSPKDMKRFEIAGSEDLISEQAVVEGGMRLLPSDSILMVTRSGILAHSFPVAITKCPVTINQDLKAVEPSPAFNSRYLAYALRALAPTILDRCTKAGTTVASVETDALGALDLPLAPASEQQRIADKLDTVLARVDAVNARLARVTPLLKRFRQSVLAAATSGRLTADWRQTNNAAELASPLIARIQEAKLAWCDKNSNHNEVSRVSKRTSSFVGCSSAIGLPAEWVVAKLEDLVLMVVDCHNKTAPYADTGIPLIRTSNVRDGDFQWEDLRFVDDEVYRHWSKRCAPEAGDLIFTREAPMGEVAIIPAGKTFCLGQRTMLIRPLSDLVSAQFIRVAVMSPAFKAFSAELAVGTGVKHLRVGDVSELQIALPGQAEQTEIVRRVELLFGFADRLEARLQAAQTASSRLTPSLLAKAFRGELVPQDPNDEPASELLKRLAQSQPVAAKKGRARKGA